MNSNNISSFTFEDIEKNLSVYSNKYYNGESIISDEEWDNMYEWYTQHNPNSKWLNNVGFIPTKGNKYKLPVYMGSLNKIKPDTKEFRKFMETSHNHQYDIVISEKLDGISLLYVNNHNKIKLFTRGNGVYGQDVSFLLDYINNFPKTSNDIIIRGELLLPKTYISDSNLRNVISGQVNSKEPNSNILNEAVFLAYSIPHSQMTPFEQFNYLNKILKCDTPKYESIKSSNVPQDFSQNLLEWRESSDYEIDGIVLSYNIFEPLSVGENPKYSKAFKTVIQDQIAKTEVLDIQWNITKDKYLKPVLIIDPVYIGKCKIQRVTGNNAKFILDNKIGLGSKLEIVRSGDVIPKVHKIITEKNMHYPNTKYIWSPNKVDLISVDENPNSNQHLLLLHFVKTIGIKFINTSLCERLINNGITNLELFITLDKEKLLQIPNIKDKLSEKLLDSIKSSLKECTLIEFVIATNKLGRNFGKSRLQLILNHISSKIIFDLDITEKSIINNLVNIDGISNKLATQFYDNVILFKQFIQKYPELKNIFLKKLNTTKINFKKKDKQPQDLTNIHLCFSGFRNSKIQLDIENRGGKVSNSLSKTTQYLVIPKDVNKMTSKMKLAKQNNIPIIHLDECIQKFNIK